MSGAERILLAEDDLDVARVVERTLGEYLFEVVRCRTGAELLQQMATRPAELCIVDLGLPDMDGMSLVRRLGERFGCAILILTGRQDLSDRVVGLELGADDYMVKPFEPRELVARVRSILRRAGRGGRAKDGTGEGQVARFAGWSFRPALHQLDGPAGAQVQLSAAEARLLMALLRSPNRILSREQLLPDDAEAVFDRSIDVRVSRLRRKIESDPREPALIKTVYGAGYVLAADVEWE